MYVPLKLFLIGIAGLDLGERIGYYHKSPLYRLCLENELAT
jgi:hypothetical protein